jgi:radical SAM protein with 4Fe4S-binding SPASM domain
MIDISVLYCGYESVSTPHRYGRAIGRDVPLHQKMDVAKSAIDRRPIVVFNITRTCNLRCIHCYSDSEAKAYEGELAPAEVRGVLDDLAAFRVPAVLFSGGEPLIRPDIFDLIEYARGKGLHAVLSTNGTLITPEIARRLVELKLAYVGISLDSATPEVHDRFRGVAGAFERTMRGFRNCVEAGQKVGLRLTLSRPTFENLDNVFDFIERERINRACFYHLVPTGRGKRVLDLSLAESRRAMNTILHRTRDYHRRGLPIEILTVDNHCDGPYMYLKMKAEGDPRAEEVYEMLRWNGGGLYSSGVGIGCIDFYGNVHADQFWMHYSLGNVRQRRFSEIWQDVTNDLMAGLKNRVPRLKGRCGACVHQALCGGSLRVRAELMTGDPWAADPACYLTDEEIGL